MGCLYLYCIWYDDHGVVLPVCGGIVGRIYDAIEAIIGLVADEYSRLIANSVETDAEDLERYGIADDIIIAGAGSAGMQHYGGYQRNT